MGREVRALQCECLLPGLRRAQRKSLWGDDTFVFHCTAHFQEVGLLFTLGMSLHKTPCPSHWVTIDCMKVQARTLKKLRWISAWWVGSHSILVPSLDRFSIHKCHYPPILPPWWRECGRSRRWRWWQSRRYCWGRSRSPLSWMFCWFLSSCILAGSHSDWDRPWRLCYCCYSGPS